MPGVIKLGIFGGTFNPIHIGHLLLAETAREQLQLDRVAFVPTRQPPHKSSAGVLAGSVRLKLIELAIRDQPAFVASDVEVGRDGASFTIDTIRILRRQLPTAKLFLLVGEDMLAVKWKEWKAIKTECTVVVAGRPGSRAHTQTGVRRLAMPLVEIASSDIRSGIRAGRSIRYRVPLAVERHILQQGLYRRAGS